MKKSTIIMMVSIVLAIALGVGGTLAYLTSTDEDVNVMTLGNVDITQLENGEDGPIDEVALYPAYINGDNIEGLIEKEVTVQNTGKSDAYVRTVIAYEAGNCTTIEEFEEIVELRFNNEEVEVDKIDGLAEIDGEKYFIAVVTYPEALAPEAITAPSLVDLYMMPEAGNDDVAAFGDTYKVLVVSQAVQTVNFEEVGAEVALKAAFGEITATNNPWCGENATSKTVTVTNDDELLAAIKDESVSNIFVDGDLTYDWGSQSYENSQALLMAGKTITGADADASITFKGYGSANPITDVTFRNITIADETKGDNEGSWEHGHLEMIDVKADNVVFANSIMLGGNTTLENCTMANDIASWYGVWVDSGNVTIKDSTFTGTRAIKVHEAYGSEVASLVVDNCSFTLSEKPGVVIGDLNADTAVTITNSTFATKAGDQDKYVYESDTAVTAFDFTEKNNVVIVDPITVGTADELVAAFASIKKNAYISLTSDIDMTGKTLDATNGNVGFILQGNGYTISNLKGSEQGLFVNNTGSSDYCFYNVNLKNCTVESTSNYAGLFVGDADTCDTLVFEGCTVTDCTVNSQKYAAGFVAYTAGYDVQNNGPVYSDVTIKDCKVIGGSITGGGSVAAAIGHAGGNPDTTNTITNLTVSGVAINGEDAAHTGTVVGTAHVGKTIIDDASVSGVTGNYNTEHPLYGRFVPNTTGTLTIDGTAIN